MTNAITVKILSVFVVVYIALLCMVIVIIASGLLTDFCSYWTGNKYGDRVLVANRDLDTLPVVALALYINKPSLQLPMQLHHLLSRKTRRSGTDKPPDCRSVSADTATTQRVKFNLISKIIYRS